MTLYRTSIGKRISGGALIFDYYSGQLSHLGDWVTLIEAKRHLKNGNSVGSEQWPEIYNEDGKRMILRGNKLVNA